MFPLQYMKPTATFNQIFASVLILFSVFFSSNIIVFAQGAATPTQTNSSGQCGDKIDNQIGDGKDYGLGLSKGDGKADHTGVYKTDGTMVYEPDPSCFSTTATTEVADDVVSTIIPCTDKCTFSDVFKLINNLLVFFIKTLLIPIFIIIIMYAGFKYITAQGNPAKKANLQKTFFNLVLGIVLVLCSWLIVHTILTMLGYTEGLLLFS